MKYLVLLIMGSFLVGCASKNYKATDYAYACVNDGKSKKNERQSNVCLPINTYENKIKFHRMRPSEMRKMPSMSDVMD